MTSKVIFRTYLTKSRAGQVIAVFPEMPADYDYLGRELWVYDPAAVDKGCHLNVNKRTTYASTRLATPAEYAPLKAEMEGCGYTLAVFNRATPAMLKTRMGYVQDEVIYAMSF